MLDRIVNVEILKEPLNWVIVPLIVIFAGLALAFLLPDTASAPVSSESGR